MEISCDVKVQGRNWLLLPLTHRVISPHVAKYQIPTGWSKISIFVFTFCLSPPTLFSFGALPGPVNVSLLSPKAINSMTLLLDRAQIYLVYSLVMKKILCDVTVRGCTRLSSLLCPMSDSCRSYIWQIGRPHLAPVYRSRINLSRHFKFLLQSFCGSKCSHLNLESAIHFKTLIYFSTIRLLRMGRQSKSPISFF